VLNRRLFALFAIICTLSLLVIGAPASRAQYAQGLPPGILSVEVDNQPIDAATVPLTNKATPQISGRVEAGLTALDLAVANGGVIRFSADVDEKGRFKADVTQSLSDGQYTLYINDALIGAFTVQGAAPSAARATGRLLDIARVVPYPSDFGDAIAGLGFLDGRFYTLEEEATRTSAASGDTSANGVRETQRSLAEAGWLQRYESRLAAPSADNPNAFALQFSSFVVEYASAADAKSAYATLTGDESGIEAQVIGDESVLTQLTGTTPDTGVQYQAARLVYRVGPLLGMIVYADLLNQQPDLGLLQTVAQAVAARASAVASGQVVPLGSMTLRLDPGAATDRINHRDLYDVQDGMLTAIYNADDAANTNRLELFTGTTDAFSATTSGTFAARNRNDQAEAPTAAPPPTSVIGIEGEQPAAQPATPAPAAGEEAAATAQLFMTSALYAFPGETEADTWLSNQRDNLRSGAASGATFSEVGDAPTLGDDSATFSVRQPIGAGEQTAGGFRIYARVGAIVAALEVGSIPDMPLAGADELMQQQIDCIEQNGCRDLAQVPNVLFGGRAQQSVTEQTPSAEAPAAAATPPPAIIVEGDESGANAAETPKAPKEPKATKVPKERKKDRGQQGEAQG
jgi:hypothetical protein